MKTCQGRSLTVAVLFGLSNCCSKIQNRDREGAARASQYFTQSEGAVRARNISHDLTVVAQCGASATVVLDVLEGGLQLLGEVLAGFRP